MKKLEYIASLFIVVILFFTISYQSVHLFSHHHLNTTYDSHLYGHDLVGKTYNLSVVEKCTVCDFKFASFLATEILNFKFYSPFLENPYTFNIKENLFFFCGSLFSHRGPPLIN